VTAHRRLVVTGGHRLVPAAREAIVAPSTRRSLGPPPVTEEETMNEAMEANESTIRALQDQVNAALLGSDWETLDRLIAPDARIIGPRGFMISRDEWIGVHKGSDYQQVRLEAKDTEVHAYERSGIRLDVMESECVYRGETIAGGFRVMQVWVTDRSRWQLAAVQYTALPAPS
jgi:hypothetical protein